jgi:hypothetical protein
MAARRRAPEPEPRYRRFLKATPASASAVQWNIAWRSAPREMVCDGSSGRRAATARAKCLPRLWPMTATRRPSARRRRRPPLDALHRPLGAVGVEHEPADGRAVADPAQPRAGTRPAPSRWRGHDPFVLRAPLGRVAVERLVAGHVAQRREVLGIAHAGVEACP